MNPDKPVHADNVPTPQPQQSFSHEDVKREAEQLWRERGQPSGQDDAIWLEAESRLQAKSEARPVSGTPSRPYVDEPGSQIRTRTKVQDPAESAVQTRSATDDKAKTKKKVLRNQ
jgi:hypothetical protein